MNSSDPERKRQMMLIAIPITIAATKAIMESLTSTPEPPDIAEATATAEKMADKVKDITHAAAREVLRETDRDMLIDWVADDLIGKTLERLAKLLRPNSRDETLQNLQMALSHMEQCQGDIDWALARMEEHMEKRKARE